MADDYIVCALKKLGF
jgi:hypothetical protein